MLKKLRFMLKKLRFMLLFISFFKNFVMPFQCPVHELPFYSFLSSLFFPSRCLLALKWFFTLLPFKHSSSRQQLQNSCLPLETTSGSFGDSATRFSGLDSLQTTLSSSRSAFAFSTGRLVCCDFRLRDKSEGRGARNLLNSDTIAALERAFPGSLLHSRSSQLHHSEFRDLCCCCCLQIPKPPTTLSWQLTWQVR